MLATVFLGAVSAVSSFLQSVTGFGFGIVMMAVMPLFLEYHSALAISTTLSMTLNIVILLKCWRDIDLKQLWLPVLFCLCGSTFGTFLMASSPSPIYKRILGVFLILLAIWLYFFSDRVRIKPTVLSAGAGRYCIGHLRRAFLCKRPPDGFVLCIGHRGQAHIHGDDTVLFYDQQHVPFGHKVFFEPYTLGHRRIGAVGPCGADTRQLFGRQGL